jgi:prevent-host-death family protein
VKVVNVYEAKTHLSKLLEAVERGEEVVIARAGRPVADLVPHRRPARPIGWGALAGEITFDDATFDEPDAEILAMFYGEPEGDDAPAR